MTQRKRLLAPVLLYLVLQACSGGSACSGCVEPIPGGFPLDRRVANAVQARVTPNAFDFLKAHYAELIATLMPGGLSFAIPESTSDVSGIGTVTICPGGGCTATLNVTSVDIQPTPPSSLVLVAQIQVITSSILVRIPPGLLCLCWDNCDCKMDIDTRRADPAYNTINATVIFSIDTRTGYTAVNVAGAGLADSIQGSDINITNDNFCGLAICSIAGIGAVKDLIIGQLQSTLTDTLTSQLSTFTCMTCPAAPAACPAGTTCDGSGYCAYSDGTCVSILLGLEGQMDLGPTLASVTPGLSAPVEFVDAAGGYADVATNGLNLGVYGGMEAISRNACVPETYTAPWLTYGPTPQAPEFSSGADFTGCKRCPTGTECSAGYTCATDGQCEDSTGVCEQVTQPVMIKLGVAERYLNRVGAGLFDAGALCLTAGTSTVAQLNSGMLSLLMPAIDKLTWAQPAPVSIEVRPQLPPKFELGDRPVDPDTGTGPDGRTMSVKLQQAQLDFYLWIYERYTKILTVQMDLDVGVRLSAEGGQLVPAITGIDAANIDASDASIVGPPNNINDLFHDLLSLVAGMIPAISPVALPTFSGFELQVPDGGITTITQVDENFLAVYANLAVAPSPSPHLETFARLTSLSGPAADIAQRAPVRLADLETVATIDVAAHSTVVTPRQTDYRWRVDGGSWSRWTRETRLVVRDARLVFAGEHVVEVQSRLADDDASIDPTPARVAVHVDGAQRYVGGMPRLGPPRVAPSEELRGRPETPPASSGCGCTAPGHVSGSSSALGLLGLAFGAVLALRRRRTLLAALAAVVLGGLAAGAGCDCGNSGHHETDTGPSCTDDGCAPAFCCPTTGTCVDLPEQAGYCAPGFDCLDSTGAFAPSFDVATCTYTTDCCAELPPLPQGFVGQHSEVAVAPSGAIWVSAYSAGASDRSPYGDLVVGTWNATAGAVDWVHVDGVPSGGTPTGAPSGWRGGVSTPGDDVGKYSTIAIGADGEPRVAYYDQTHGALKFAVHAASGWTVQHAPVDDQGDAGRYADLAIGPDGRAAISYNAVSERTDLPGAFVSQVKVAWAADAAASSWTVSEIESVDIPCWKDECATGQVCLASTRVCVAPESDDTACGTAGCSTGQACVGTTCEDLFETPIDFPEGVGIVTGIAFMPDGSPLVVYYDRGAWDRTTDAVVPHGDLKQAAWAAGAWTVTVLDGAGGDAGWYPSVAVDAAGQRHFAYVDGIAENLMYLNPDAGVREVVDGRSLAGRGRSIVGDDSTIRVSHTGQVWIAYQDASARQLLLAHRTAPATWEVQQIDTQDNTGFYANMDLDTDGETPVLSTYWHRTSTTGTTTTHYTYTAGVRVFTVTP